VNCRTVLIVVVVSLGMNIARRCSLAGIDSTVCGQETTGACGEAEARNRRLLAGWDLRIGVGNLFEMGLEAADRRRSGGLYGLGLYRR